MSVAIVGQRGQDDSKSEIDKILEETPINTTYKVDLPPSPWFNLVTSGNPYLYNTPLGQERDDIAKETNHVPSPLPPPLPPLPPHIAKNKPTLTAGLFIPKPLSQPEQDALAQKQLLEQKEREESMKSYMISRELRAKAKLPPNESVSSIITDTPPSNKKDSDVNSQDADFDQASDEEENAEAPLTPITPPPPHDHENKVEETTSVTSSSSSPPSSSSLSFHLEEFKLAPNVNEGTLRQRSHRGSHSLIVYRIAHFSLCVMTRTVSWIMAFSIILFLCIFILASIVESSIASNRSVLIIPLINSNNDLVSSDTLGIKFDAVDTTKPPCFRQYTDRDIHSLTHLKVALLLEDYLEKHPDELCASAHEVGRVWHHLIIRVPWTEQEMFLSDYASFIQPKDAIERALRYLQAVEAHINSNHKDTNELIVAILTRSLGYINSGLRTIEPHLFKFMNEVDIEEKEIFHNDTSRRPKFYFLHLLNPIILPASDSVVMDTIEKQGVMGAIRPHVRHSHILVHFEDIFTYFTKTTSFRDGYSACIQYYDDIARSSFPC